MSNFDRNYAVGRGAGADRAIAIDKGLRAYMLRVYNTMAMGVALTGIVAWLTYQAAVVTNEAGNIVGLTSFGQAIFGGPAVIILVLATLGLVFFISFRIQHLQVGTALGLFLLYAGLLGVMLSSIFLAYTGASITRTFFISAASFGALSSMAIRPSAISRRLGRSWSWACSGWCWPCWSTSSSRAPGSTS